MPLKRSRNEMSKSVDNNNKPIDKRPIMCQVTGLYAQNQKAEYYNLGGTVFAGEYPLENFHASLTYNYSDIYIQVEQTYFDTLGYDENGVYERSSSEKKGYR